MKQADGATPAANLLCDHGISNACFHKRRTKYGGMDASFVVLLEELGGESRRLKKYAEEKLKSEIVKEAPEKK